MAMGAFQSAFKAANEANAKEALAQARNILTANEALRTALGGVGSTVEDALKKLQDMAAGKSGDGAALKLPPINFGPRTFNIKQDFRDDPDRVAIIFRQDIAKHAASRISARTSTPFGV